MGCLAARPSTFAVPKDLPNNKSLKSILNNDINNLLISSSGASISSQEYKRSVRGLLAARPLVLAQNVGMPDPVIYRSKVGTHWNKHIVEISLKTWPKSNPTRVRETAQIQAAAMRSLVAMGTDPLELTIEVCRQKGVLILASYRMNAEDWHKNTWMLSDFGRAHEQSRIPDTGALDPMDPEVYNHRKDLFREVAENFDIDGIEFDYMRWNHMISKPRENYPILTREVSETRKMLDEVARKKGRERLILGARVGYSLDGPPVGRSDFSCKDLGLDIKNWIDRGLVDYLCPSYFWPRLPGMPKTTEFVELAKNSKTGIYPTVFPYAAWQDEPKQTLIAETNKEAMARLLREICQAGLKGYAEGADGLSTFNWVHHHQPGMVHNPMRTGWGLGSKKVQMRAHQNLGSPAALRECLKAGMTEG